MFAHRMFSLVALLLSAGVVLSLTSSRVTAQDAKDDVTGTWKWTSEGFGGQQETTLKLKQEGEKVTGTVSGFQGDDQIQEGKVKDGTVTFKVTRDFGGRAVVTMFTCKITGDSIKGKSETIFAQDIDGKKSK